MSTLPSPLDVEGAVLQYMTKLKEALSPHTSPTQEECDSGKPSTDCSSEAAQCVNGLLLELATLNAENAKLLSDIIALDAPRTNSQYDPQAQEEGNTCFNGLADDVAAALEEADAVFMTDRLDLRPSVSVSMQPQCDTAVTGATGGGDMEGRVTARKDEGADKNLTTSPLTSAHRRLAVAILQPEKLVRCTGVQTDPSVPIFNPYYDVTEEMLAAIGMNVFTETQLLNILRPIGAKCRPTVMNNIPPTLRPLFSNDLTAVLPSESKIDITKIVGSYESSAIVGPSVIRCTLIIIANKGMYAVRRDGLVQLVLDFSLPASISLGQSHKSFEKMRTSYWKHLHEPCTNPGPPLNIQRERDDRQVGGDCLARLYHRSFTIVGQTPRTIDVVPEKANTGNKLNVKAGINPPTPLVQTNKTEEEPAPPYFSAIFDCDSDMNHFTSLLWIISNNPVADHFSLLYNLQHLIPRAATKKNPDPISVGYREAYPHFMNFDTLSLTEAELALCSCLHLHPRKYQEAVMELVENPFRTWFSLGDVAALLAEPSHLGPSMLTASGVASFFEHSGLVESVDLIERLPQVQF